MRKLFQPALFAILLTFLSTQSNADPYNTEFSNMTLQGIDTVALEVSGLSSHFKSFGLDKEKLTRETEEQLREAGIKLISRNQLITNETASLIKLRINDIKTDLGIISYAVNLDVIEKVPLPRRSNAFISATIWNNGAHGVIRHHEADKLRAVIRDVVDSFISEHRRQNGFR